MKSAHSNHKRDTYLGFFCVRGGNGARRLALLTMLERFEKLLALIYTILVELVSVDNFQELDVQLRRALVFGVRRVINFQFVCTTQTKVFNLDETKAQKGALRSGPYKLIAPK
eukprot:COSAG02_NODE_22669_length_744_cov_1.586047_1_plen_113_part_00